MILAAYQIAKSKRRAGIIVGAINKFRSIGREHGPNSAALVICDRLGFSGLQVAAGDLPPWIVGETRLPGLVVKVAAVWRSNRTHPDLAGRTFRCLGLHHGDTRTPFHVVHPHFECSA